jgi:hypothetical protein
MEKEIFTALISAGTSIGTVILFKPVVDKHLLKFQLKQNYISEQSKKVKEHIAKYKGQLLSSAELLNSRLKNYAKNHNELWLICNGDYINARHMHYVDTTTYRFLAFFANIKIIEKDLIYLDTTISQKVDLRMIKYFRLFHEVMCDVDLFKNFQYDKTYQTDHFFTSPFYNLANNLIENNKVIELDEFLSRKTILLPKIELVYKYFDSISPSENRLRCERLKAFHLILISFLNEYGYDFQRTTAKRQAELKVSLGDYKLLDNLEHLVEKFKINNFWGHIEKVISRAR